MKTEAEARELIAAMMDCIPRWQSLGDNEAVIAGKAFVVALLWMLKDCTDEWPDAAVKAHIKAKTKGGMA